MIHQFPLQICRISIILYRITPFSCRNSEIYGELLNDDDFDDRCRGRQGRSF
jgi:hypothetical protein